MDVNIQILHSTRKGDAWGNWPSIGHDPSVHPVIFRSATRDKIEGFPVVPASPGGSQRASTTGECSHDAIVIGSGNKSCFPETRVSLEANFVFIYVGIACETIDHPADAPGPGHQSTRIFRLSKVSFVHQPDEEAGQIGAAAIGLERSTGISTSSESGRRSKVKSRSGATKRDDHGRLDPRLFCGKPAGDRD